MKENFSGVGPCESSHPDLSENVVVLGRGSFLTGVIAAESQKTCHGYKFALVLNLVIRWRHLH